MGHVGAASERSGRMGAHPDGGYCLVTASEAGLVNIVESAAYGVTKHAAVAIAEWLSIAYGRKGLRVSCLCPQAVRTGMVPGEGGSAGGDGILSAEVVADEIGRVMGEETFLVLPHQEVLQYMRRKTEDYDRWLGGMQKLFMKNESKAPWK